MNVALIGPSGVGKGTQVQQLKNAFGMQHFCPGNLFREAVKNRTPMGLAAKKHFEHGDLVPDDIVNGMLEEWIWSTHPKASIVFDGYPRTPLQAVFLDEMFQELDRKLDSVIYLQAPDDLIIQRIAPRRFCRVCPAEFHLSAKPFGACPYQRCKGEYLYQQREDKPEALGARLALFHRSVNPLLKYYEHNQKLHVVQAHSLPDIVHQEIVQILQSLPA